MAGSASPSSYPARRHEPDLDTRNAVEVTLELEGATTPIDLATSLREIDGVLEPHTTDTSDTGD
jgi:hypothetical protein